MQSGALAFIDALGFKEIWKRAEPDDVLKKLKDTFRTTSQGTEIWNASPGVKGAPEMYGEVRATFLSDSIVLSVVNGTEPERTRYTAQERALHVLLMHVVDVLRMGALIPPSIAYRGCVTIGEFEVDDRFVLGPAVDRAAAYEREAEGAFVWLDPKARTLVETGRSFEGHDLQQAGLHRYSVPLKQGKCFDTYAVAPFRTQFAIGSVVLRKNDNAPEIADRILSTFDSKALDVVIKRDNTKRFLDHAIAGREE